MLVRGWSRSDTSPHYYFEKVVDGRWVWFCYYNESVGCYIFCTDVISDEEEIEKVRMHREGVRKMLIEIEEICKVLSLSPMTHSASE